MFVVATIVDKKWFMWLEEQLSIRIPALRLDTAAAVKTLLSV